MFFGVQAKGFEQFCCISSVPAEGDRSTRARTLANSRSGHPRTLGREGSVLKAISAGPEVIGSCAYVTSKAALQWSLLCLGFKAAVVLAKVRLSSFPMHLP